MKKTFILVSAVFLSLSIFAIVLPTPERYLPKKEYVETRSGMMKRSHIIALSYLYSIDHTGVYFGDRKITDADTATFRLITMPGSNDIFKFLSYAQDKNYVYWQGQVIDGFLPENVEFLDEEKNIVKNKEFVVQRDRILEDIDGASFHLLNKAFAIDKDNVYRIEHYGINKFYDADPETFTPLPDGYSKDGNNVWHKNTRLKGADPATFTVETGKEGYAKDKNYVYNKGVQVFFSDPGTAVLFKDYATDINYVYINKYSYEKVEGSDPLTFRIIDEKKGIAKDKNYVYYDRKIITEADPGSYDTILASYSKDKKHVYYNDRIILLAHAASFSVVSPFFAKDKKNIYYKNELITENLIDPRFDLVPDRKTFAPVFNLNNEISPDYYKDKEYVYFFNKNRMVSLNGVDPASFVVINEREKYTKDKQHVYHQNKIFAKADPNSFTVINRYYSKDKQHVYLEGVVIEGADPASFVVINKNYSKDNAHVYYKKTQIEKADPATFEIINDYYNKDKQYVYYQHMMLKKADPATFHAFYTDTHAKDKNYVWYRDTEIPGADPNTFEIIYEGTYTKDKNAVYSGTKIIDNDPKNFKVYPRGHAYNNERSRYR